MGINVFFWRYLFLNRVDFLFRLIVFDEDEGEIENVDIKNDSLLNLYDIILESKLWNWKEGYEINIYLKLYL